MKWRLASATEPFTEELDLPHKLLNLVNWAKLWKSDHLRHTTVKGKIWAHEVAGLWVRHKSFPSNNKIFKFRFRKIEHFAGFYFKGINILRTFSQKIKFLELFILNEKIVLGIVTKQYSFIFKKLNIFGTFDFGRLNISRTLFKKLTFF